jgi:hypothetical protein
MVTERPAGGSSGAPVPRLQDREALARPGVLRRAVAELEEILTRAGRGSADRPDPRLRELASPPVLATLLRLALVAAVRRGPAGGADGPTPARLLAAAAAAAAAGWLAVPALVSLRRSLTELEAELGARGAWDSSAPPWWQPLPAPGPLEDFWRDLDEGFGRALVPATDPEPEPDPERAAPAADRQAPAWLHLPAALPPDLLASLQEGLERSAGRGELALAPGGVGAAGERSRHRSDAVVFLTGLEPDLLARVPGLAVLVQWLLDRGGERLGRALLPDRKLFAPQTAMLARYRAPATGFAPHLDNPGGAHDNGRAMAAVLYLGAPGRACAGGELELWPPVTPGATGEGASSLDGPPATALPAAGGSAVLFDARRVPHAVRALEPGPDRWTLVVWLNETSRRPPDEALEAPPPSVGDALAGVDDPPVAPDRVLFRELRGGTASVDIAVHPVPPGPPPRVGVTTTVDPVRAAGPWAPALDGWVRHHLELGADHLLVIVDEPCGAEELSRVRRRLGSLGSEAVTVWSAEEARGRWPTADGAETTDRGGEAVSDLGRLRRQAGAGPAAWAVAARQSLNASAALAAARGDELGGRPLDWLVHLDSDELLVLAGAGRGGASLAEHFAAARAAGLVTVRYANHELLLPWEPGASLRFKANPLLAAARLGRAGWEKLVALLGLEQDGPRPYFRAYWNGKSAVAVAAGTGASGVHAWEAEGAVGSAGQGVRSGLLAGPAVLHVHLPTADSFRVKYLRIADGLEGPEGSRPFPPSPLEASACELIRSLRTRGASTAEVDRLLDELYAASCVFETRQVELLELAGLLITPDLGPGRGLTEAGAEAGDAVAAAAASADDR